MNNFKSFLQKENEIENKKGKTIYIDYDRIDWLKDKDFKEFKSFKIKRGKKKRTCYKSENEDDKEILEIIYQYLVKNIVPKVNYKKSIIRITKQIQGRLKKGYWIIYKTDIDNFFESIDHETLIMKVNKLEDELLNVYLNKFIKAPLNSLHKNSYLFQISKYIHNTLSYKPQISNGVNPVIGITFCFIKSFSSFCC